MIDVSLFFFFNDTAPTEIYTSCTLFPDTTLFRSTAGDVLLERWAQRTLAEDEPAQPRSFPAGEGRCVQQQLQPLLRVQPGCGHDEVVSLVDAELGPDVSARPRRHRRRAGPGNHPHTPAPGTAGDGAADPHRPDAQRRTCGTGG